MNYPADLADARRLARTLDDHDGFEALCDWDKCIATEATTAMLCNLFGFEFERLPPAPRPNVFGVADS